ncbi:MAG TPA: 3-deoxy-manno-octulosonate cytidylyltransferase [Gammaproteobacteria bacterium]|nr:3-deoxy-manno-octulosonate cytidylyltransferase [Gammaproteobacteria bacterium]HAU07284.1 3-deoxy-manno-octulosonate cytidylyltransferase [Gammaproteobacteria bacterium]
MNYHIIIPARYDSQRLPGKVLMDIAGKPMITHVYQQAQQSDAQQIIIATDHQAIYQVAAEMGATVCMTQADHPSGTDRLAEVVQQYQYHDDDIIVNVQGDEPMLPPALINQVAQDLQQYPEADMATLFSPIDTITDIFDPNVVKVTIDQQGYANYFSRAPIPWVRHQFPDCKQCPDDTQHLRHIGLYAYRVNFLRSYSQLAPCSIEKAESLEQLRALYYGKRIHLSEAKIDPGHGIDTQQDLERVRQLLSA